MLFKKYLGVLLPSIILVLTIVGTKYNSIEFLYASLGLILITLTFRLLNWIDPSSDGVSLYLTGLSLIYLNTLPTDYILGNDIHGEYYFSFLALRDGWDINLPFEYNFSILTGIVIPHLSRALGLSLEVIFKALLPLCLAFVPVVCYWIAKEVLSPAQAFISTFFLITVPTFFLEIPGIGKQMVGELLLILTIYLLLSSKLTNFKKGVISLILGGLTIATHYSMGIMLILYISGATLILTGVKYIFKQNIIISLKPPTLVLLSLLLIFGVYYSLIGEGRFLKVIVLHSLYQTSQVLPVLGIDNTEVLETSQAVSVGLPVPSSSLKPPAFEPSKATPLPEYFKFTGLLGLALGSDFMEAPLEGKVFRVLQYTTQALLIIGALYLLFIRKERNWPFLAFFLSGWVCLLGVVLIPFLAGVLNATRFYHLALLAIAPAFLAFLRKPYLALLILIPYFLFTSGVVFEVLKVNSIDGINIPYSYGLSGYRVDATGLYSTPDAKVRDYIYDNNLVPIYGDQWGTVLLVEKLGPNVWRLPLNTREVPNKAYIYLRERNTETGTLCFWSGPGSRLNKTFEEVGFNKVLEGRPIIKIIKGAYVYGPKGL